MRTTCSGLLVKSCGYQGLDGFGLAGILFEILQILCFTIAHNVGTVQAKDYV